MFYLLENNRIVCDEEIIKEIKETFSGDLNIEIKNNELQFTYINDRGIKYIVLEPRKFKKQSENVYDLIEIGDLVRYEDDFLGATLLAEVYMNYGKLSLFDETDIKNLDILAIYKPDEEGNYIKAWEKKDERKTSSKDD